MSAVATVQSGDAITILYNNSDNVFGISPDRAQLSGSCTKGQIVTPGSVQSKLNNYFDPACFTTPPVAFLNSYCGFTDNVRMAGL